MRNLILIPVLLALGACSTFSGAEDFFTEAREKGTEISDTSLTKAAEAFDLYCVNTPDAVRSFLRAEINARTEQYDASDFCVPKAE